MNAKILGQIFLASAAFAAGHEVGRMLPMIGARICSKRFREEVKADYKKREAKLTVVS